jgi:tetratricopeptide (TPR) repeat protein
MTETPAHSLDPETLREIYADPAAVAARIDELRTEIRDAPDEIAELVARADLVVLLRGSGRLDEALNEANAAVDRAEIAGTSAQQHTARVRLAHVHQWRGEFGESNLLFTELLAAAKQFGLVIEAFTYQHAGKNDYDQGHWADARDHFAGALKIRDDLELPDDEREASRLALAAARRHLDAREPDA